MCKDMQHFDTCNNYGMVWNNIQSNTAHLLVSCKFTEHIQFSTFSTKLIDVSAV